MVLKPSEMTPISASLYAQVIDEAGFPAGVFNMVHGDGPNCGAALSRHSQVAMMSFTGSARGGIAVLKDSADLVKKVTLELGGKSPNLVFADADLSQVIPASVAECFYHSGQSCDAPTRMLVEESVYDEVLMLAKQYADSVKLGNPADEGDFLGPVINASQHKADFGLYRYWYRRGGLEFWQVVPDAPNGSKEAIMSARQFLLMLQRICGFIAKKFLVPC